MLHNKIMVQGTPVPLAALQEQKYLWLVYPLPIAIGYVLIHAAYNEVSLFVPVIIFGVCAGLLRSTLVQTLKAAMVGSVSTLVFTVLLNPNDLESIAQITGGNPIVYAFAVFMIFYLVGGLFCLYFINTLRRMSKNAKGKTRGKISKTS